MQTYSQSLASRISKVMEQAGCTQRELATLLGISQPAISLYLRGRVPPAGVLLALARLGNTTIEWLLTGDGLQRENLMISEPRPGYGREGKLLEIWRELDSDVRDDLLRLMQRLRK